MKHFILVLISLVAFSPLFAQAPAQPAPQANQPQEVIVKIQQQAAPVPEAPKTVVAKANEWVDFGKNVGTAMDAGLTSLTDHAEKFSKTDAGRFTMAVIAWKVAGRDAMDVTKYVTDKAVKILFGIPCLGIWVSIGFWWFRRMYVPHRIVTKKEGFLWWGKKEYEWLNRDRSWSEGRVGGCIISAIVVIGVGLVILFNVIL